MTPKPYRIDAPTTANTGAAEIGKALKAILGPSRQTGGRGRRSVSNNPAHTDNSAQRVTRRPSTSSAPKKQKPLSVYEKVVLGYTEDDSPDEEPGAGAAQTEYLSPPNTIFPERPRAREAFWDPDSREMQVVFRNGGTYRYYGVTRKDWSALKRNHSFGQTLDRLVIGTYPYQKVSE